MVTFFPEEVVGVLQVNTVSYTLAEGKRICSSHQFNSKIKFSHSYKWHFIGKWWVIATSQQRGKIKYSL